MIGYHVTNLENLSSILDEGIEARITTENNFPGAMDNGHKEKVFFMTNLHSAWLWAQCHHKWIANCTDDEKENELYSGIEMGDEDMVIIEFNSPFSYPDPYAWNEINYMKDSRYTEKNISSRYIVDIHEVNKEGYNGI